MNSLLTSTNIRLEANGRTEDTGMDEEIWEFTHCDQCMLPFLAPDSSQASVPFWLTECGHVLCNNHISRDQSCSRCKAVNVTVFPLQKNLPSPLNTWFGSIPAALDAAAQTVKFQQAVISAEARFYKAQCTRLREMLEKTKQQQNAFRDLQKANENLQQEVVQLRAQLRQHDNVSRLSKRPRLESGGTTPTMADTSMGTRYEYDRDGRSSTSHSTTSPGFAHPRLTLPIDNSQTIFQAPQDLHRPSPQRPVGSLSHFAYQSPTSRTPSMFPKQQHSFPDDNSFASPSTTASQRIMPPPAVPNRFQFKPSSTSTPHKTHGTSQQNQKKKGFRPAGQVNPPVAKLPQTPNRPRPDGLHARPMSSMSMIPASQTSNGAHQFASNSIIDHSQSRFNAAQVSRVASTAPSLTFGNSANRQPFRFGK